MSSAEIEYTLSGQAAVVRLEKTGKCRQCDLSGQNLTRAFAVLKKKNKRIDVAGSDLSSTICTGSDWSKGDFSYTILDDAILFNVVTEGANFTDASMKRVKMVSPVFEKTNSSTYPVHPNQQLYTKK